jgi:hypothetical protein
MILTIFFLRMQNKQVLDVVHTMWIILMKLCLLYKYPLGIVKSWMFY